MSQSCGIQTLRGFSFHHWILAISDYLYGFSCRAIRCAGITCSLSRLSDNRSQEHFTVNCSRTQNLLSLYPWCPFLYGIFIGQDHFTKVWLKGRVTRAEWTSTKLMDILLLGCCTRFSCTLITWCLLLAKNNDTHPPPPSGWTNWPIMI